MLDFGPLPIIAFIISNSAGKDPMKNDIPLTIEYEPKNEVVIMIAKWGHIKPRPKKITVTAHKAKAKRVDIS